MQTDVTTTDSLYRLLAWFETNKKQVTWGVSALVVIGLLAWFIVWRQSEKEVSASEALSHISTPSLGNGGARTDTAEAYLKFAANYPSSSAATRAQLLAAGSLFVDGKYPEAQAQFEKFMREHHDSPFMSGALLGAASCLDAQGKTNEAMTAYKNIVDHHPSEYVGAQAKFALASLYEAQGKPELARPYFEELAKIDPNGSIGSEAGMRLEEIKAKFPTVVPQTTPPAVTPATNMAPVKLEQP